MTFSLPAPSEGPAEKAAVEKAAVKPAKPSKASKAPKPVEVPPEAFQREEQPFEPPPVVQKVSQLVNSIFILDLAQFQC